MDYYDPPTTTFHPRGRLMDNDFVRSQETISAAQELAKHRTVKRLKFAANAFAEAGDRFRVSSSSVAPRPGARGNAAAKQAGSGALGAGAVGEVAMSTDLETSAA